MTPTTLTQLSGGNTSAEATSQTQKRINAVHAILNNCGCYMSPSKVNRIVRQFEHQAERNGWTFVDFLTNKVALSAEQRRQVLADPDTARIFPYRDDPTGEDAVNNVMRRVAGA